MELMILAFIAGGAGAFIGGTQTFVITGFVGILSCILEICGVEVTFFNDYVLNTFFLPCIIFNGAVVATAYSAKHYEIRGMETNRSLAFTNDLKVILLGGLGGVFGYLVYAMANHLNLPLDTGALSVLTIAVVTRLLFNQEQHIHRDNLKNFWSLMKQNLPFQLVLAVIFSAAMAYFAYESKLYTIGFSISALSLIFGFTDSAFPATHHITLVAGYAVMQTGNIGLGILFGVISHILCYMFTVVFNTDCGTHVDPPAVGIAVCSFILFTLF